MSRRPGAVARRQRLASATVLALAVAFVWSGLPDVLAAQLAAARLGFVDVVVLMVVAAVGVGAAGAVVLLVLADVIELRREWVADRQADEDRRAVRFHVEPSPTGPLLSSHDVEELVHRMRGVS